MSGQSGPLYLRSALLADGSRVDVVISGGRISSVIEATQRRQPIAPGEENEPPADLDLSGYILLPSPVEPHAHLDKALLGERVPNQTGDLVGAVAAIRAAYESMTAADVGTRSLAAITEAVTRGFTAVRTHVDCGTGIGTRTLVPLVELRERLRDVIDIQIVALSVDPSGTDTAEGLKLLTDGMDAGADFVGGCPALEPRPEQTIDRLIAVARDYGRGVDLHMDETTDASILNLRYLAETVIGTGFEHPVTASHCVSLGMQDERIALETACMVAEARIGVVTLPQTNLVLQGRGMLTRKPRGVTAIDALRSAGVTVAGGSDNWRDPFNPVGRIDPMETASLLVSVGQLMPADAYASVSEQARAVMGLPEVRVAAGYPADLMAVKASSVTQAVAQASDERIVIKAGRVLARTRVRTERHPALGGY